MDAYKCSEFRKKSANESPPRDKFVGKIPTFDGFGGYVPTLCADKCKIRHGLPDFTSIEATCRPCGTINPFFGPLRKRNTSMLPCEQACR